MDETPLWLDIPGETTVTHTGERSVPVRTTGHEKNRFTVVLAAMADGRKLKPYVVFKGVRPIPELNKVSGVVVALSNNGWMNKKLTKDWVLRCWGRLNFGRRRRLLVWDAYKCLIMDSVKDVVKKQVNFKHYPWRADWPCPASRCVLEQPIQSFKDFYTEWTANGQKTYTAAGNVRAPAKLLGLEWVNKAWESVSADVVNNSFLSCGISVKTDGSEDSQIHCIKEGGIAEAAKDEITRTKMLSPQQVEESEDDQGDPFADRRG